VTEVEPPDDGAPDGRPPDGPVVCCDLDGVIWRGDDAIPGSAEAVATLRASGLRVTFLSNNSSAKVDSVVAKLARCGVTTAPATVLTSAIAAAHLLATGGLAPGARVLACAGPGVVEALEQAGFTAVREPPAAAVVVGWHRDFDFAGLERASRAVRDGARFVATNLDATYPVPGGVVPGAGAIVAAVAIASGHTPEVAGKPFPPTAALVHRRFGAEGVMVGDRPSTDGAMADTLGWPFALVLSGVASADPDGGGEPIPAPPPPFVADDLAALTPRLVAALAHAPRPGPRPRPRASFRLAPHA
jgi:4-nitrophenyl phosphatase